MDQADLYDYEVAKISSAWVALQQKWSSKANTKHNLQEFAKEANDMFVRMGFVVNIQWENTLIIDPSTMSPYPITIEIMGRVPGTEFQEEGLDMHDHDYKKWEVLNANTRGEKYHGQKENNRGRGDSH
jgi:hypothetical protein